jgi:hypothetical protein
MPCVPALYTLCPLTLCLVSRALELMPCAQHLDSCALRLVIPLFPCTPPPRKLATDHFLMLTLLIILSSKSRGRFRQLVNDLDHSNTASKHASVYLGAHFLFPLLWKPFQNFGICPGTTPCVLCTPPYVLRSTPCALCSTPCVLSCAPRLVSCAVRLVACARRLLSPASCAPRLASCALRLVSCGMRLAFCALRLVSCALCLVSCVMCSAPCVLRRSLVSCALRLVLRPELCALGCLMCSKRHVSCAQCLVSPRSAPCVL